MAALWKTGLLGFSIICLSIILPFLCRAASSGRSIDTGGPQVYSSMFSDPKNDSRLNQGAETGRVMSKRRKMEET